MSTNFPPGGPQGSGPEYLEQGGGSPLPPSTEPRARAGKKPAVIAGGAIAGLLLVGGGIWAATWYFSTGAQPAEALPASTLGYVSIDLDPSGQQKIEALKTLNKFPAIKQQLGLDAEDDVRKKIFDEFAKDTGCDLDFADDVEPWLGNRAAVAAVDTGKEQPSPVFVVQVTDEDKADEGMGKIRDCAGGSSSDSGSDEGSGGWAIDGGWAVIAETDAIAQDVVDEAADSPLTDDSDYQKWTGEVGDSGIINAYAAPSAGDYMAEHLGDFGFPFGGSASSCAVAPGTDPSACDDYQGSSSAAVPSELSDMLKDFQGLAATVRFDSGALELEAAGDPGAQQKQIYGTDAGDDVVATLPEDTAAAIGVGFEQGWFTRALEQFSTSSGQTAEQMMSDLEQESGLDLPADAETLAGESLSLSVGSDFDPETLFNSSDGSGVPIAAKVKGDPDAIEGVLEKLRKDVPPSESAPLDSDSSGDTVAIGPDSGYRSQVLEHGNLGDSEVFQNVVREADRASALFYLNFDAGSGWLEKLAGDDQETVDNLKPLQGLGMSVWQKDGVGHAVLRVTTD